MTALTVIDNTFLGAILYGFLSIVLYHLWSFRLYRSVAKFPGPTALPIVGNALYFLGSTEDIMNTLVKLVKQFPSPFRIWLGNHPLIFVHDAEQLKEVYLSPHTIEKADIYDIMKPLLGMGLFTAPASKWRIHRKLLAPTFGTLTIESFVPVFAAHSNILVQQMQDKLFGEEFDIYSPLSSSAFNIICETVMGLSVGAQDEGSCQYVESMKRLCRCAGERLMKIWLRSDIIFNRTQLGKHKEECIKYVHSFTDTIIQKRRGKLSQDEQRTGKGQNGTVLLDLLMELSKDGTKFTDGEVRDEVTTITFAGYDTTAASVSFAILMLAMHQDIQDKVYEELREIYKDDVSGDTLVAYEDLHRMEYMERVIKETMRLFPTGPFLARRATEDIAIGEHTVPAGSSIVIAVMSLHRKEKYWPNPLKFDPDRFLSEETLKRHPYSYLPFSAGIRNCIGVKYAMASMKTTLATILRQYVIKKNNIVPVKDIKLNMHAVLKPVDPITIRIEKRNADVY